MYPRAVDLRSGRCTDRHAQHAADPPRASPGAAAAVRVVDRAHRSDRLRSRRQARRPILRGGGRARTGRSRCRPPRSCGWPRTPTALDDRPGRRAARCSDQLARMADGYARSDGTTVPAEEARPPTRRPCSKTLRKVVDATPCSCPRCPSPRRCCRPWSPADSRTTCRTSASLGAETTDEPAGACARRRRWPVHPTGAIDDPALDDLAAQGVGAVLANADAVDRTAQPNDFAPLPAATITTSVRRPRWTWCSPIPASKACWPTRS